MKVTIFHNPRCSKSRQALEIIRTHGIEPDIIEYLKTPPDPAQLSQILALLKLSARELLRTGEQAYKDEGLADTGLNESALIDAMCRHPILIERPIVMVDDKATIGRPPERVQALLS